jgi:hypothetical protein
MRTSQARGNCSSQWQIPQRPLAEWTDMDALAAARPHMIATLDTFRDTLEDLGSGLGVTDPVSGPVVLALK